MIKIKEAIVVEGKDDVSAILAAVEAFCIPTCGYGIKEETMALIKKAYENQGIIIFTDPDFAGKKIRERILKECPKAKEAFLTRDEAKKDGDIGIENASPEAIRKALERVLLEECVSRETFTPYTEETLFSLGLCGWDYSSSLRNFTGKALGIGSGNGKTFLKKLNHFRIERKEIEKLCQLFKDEKK